LNSCPEISETGYKRNLTKYIRSNFVAERDYIVVQSSGGLRKHGGHNRKQWKMTKLAADLVETSFNLKHRYTPFVKGLTQVMTVMSLENQTVGFAASCFEGVVAVARQHRIGPYSVDLCFPDHRLVVECDEMGHRDRDASYERSRESYIKAKGYTVIRFDPNEAGFDFAIVMRKINMHISRFRTV
jgi:very-short-patch-repair endonuclease